MGHFGGGQRHTHNHFESLRCRRECRNITDDYGDSFKLALPVANSEAKRPVHSRKPSIEFTRASSWCEAVFGISLLATGLGLAGTEIVAQNEVGTLRVFLAVFRLRQCYRRRDFVNKPYLKRIYFQMHYFGSWSRAPKENHLPQQGVREQVELRLGGLGVLTTPLSIKAKASVGAAG